MIAVASRIRRKIGRVGFGDLSCFSRRRQFSAALAAMRARALSSA
jgi:hypothetical protein